MAPNFDNSRYDEAFEQRVIDCLAEFAAGAGHELNNPLAIISGIAQRLLSDETDLKKRTDLAKVIAQTKRAFEMIADIRGFARPPKPELTMINASDFFNEWTVRESRREISKNVKIEILPSDAQNIEIKTDEAILATALGAIGKNAAEAVSSRNGTLVFFMDVCEIPSDELDEGAFSPRFLEIGVEDDGPGLSEEDARLVFSPYFSGRQAGRGLGFGLSKAWRFVETIGCRIVCEQSRRFASGCKWSVLAPLD